MKELKLDRINLPETSDWLFLYWDTQSEHWFTQTVYNKNQEDAIKEFMKGTLHYQEDEVYMKELKRPEGK